MRARRQLRDNQGKFKSRKQLYADWAVLWLMSFVVCWMIGTAHQYITKTWFRPSMVWPTPVMAYDHSVLVSPVPLEAVGVTSNILSGIALEEARAVSSPTPTATPTPTSTPSPIPTIYIPPTFEAQHAKVIIEEVFGSQAQQALRVARCESGIRNVCNDGLNRDGSVDCGVFQVNLSAHNKTREEMLDARSNIEFAYSLYQRSGWGPWYSSYKCHKLK